MEELEGPKVSIIIPFYNCPYIDQAINSALEQSYPYIEIIVVDDGSTMHADKITPFLDRVSYLGKANGGTASALNHGIRQATGQYVVWLSSDDLFYPDKVRNQLAFMQKNQAMISYTSFDEIDDQRRFLNFSAGMRFRNYREFITCWLKHDPINGCTVMIQKGMFTHIGYFDESLPFTHDYDLWIRFILNGIPIHFVDESLTKYRWHEQMGTKKHWPEIEREIAFIQSKYKLQLEAIIAHMEVE
ncbi:glycosyltransferase [Paenibacillus sp. HWE-109]|uniref:glycosyltransferase family 2 protein n=1 Tax=Paenibacillus sp. HWE-109 TaxID=1306526 RepID=UPI001EE106C4|nr:glycosyltransferase [Paenibacillus sp. HWE-109]UKS30999.1 glycosyltransferase [Paenibacillus sp. HWE-109]